jgi:hypothetical protein
MLVLLFLAWKRSAGRPVAESTRGKRAANGDARLTAER